MSPKEVVIFEGHSDRITCNSTKTTQWWHEGKSLPINAKSAGQVLTLTNVQVTNRGSYECQGTTSEGDKFYALALVKIKGRFVLLVVI